MILSESSYFLLAITIVANSLLTRTQSKQYFSLDRFLRAVIIPVGKKGYESAESRVEIRGSSGKALRWKSFASQDGEHGMGVIHTEWTVDSQFFVFNTGSSGGHQPWHLATYFYSRGENKFYCLDDYIGPVTSDFILEGRNSVKTTRLNFKANNEKEPVTVKLSKLLDHGQRRSTPNKP